MALKANIENFRVLQDVQFEDSGVLTILLGYNEAGKTTFVNALKYACTGEAFGHKGKQIQPLITYGQQTAKVHMTIDKADGYSIGAKRSTSGNGDSLSFVAEQFGVPKALMPLLFDARMCGDGGNKVLQKFLSSAAVTGFDAATHFSADAAVIPYVSEAIRAGKKTVAQIVDYCAQKRAAQKGPPQPVKPTAAEPEPEVVEAAFAHTTAAAAVLQEAEAQKTATRTQGLILTQIAQHIREVAAFDVARKAASVSDVLGNRRVALQKVSGLNIAGLQAIAESLTAAQLTVPSLPQAVADIGAAIQSAQALLAENPPPPSMPAAPVLPSNAQAVWDGLAAKGPVVEETIGNLAQQNILVENQALAAVESAQAEKNTADSRYAALVQTKGAWAAYNAAVPKFNSETEAAQSRWNQWDHAIKALQSAEAQHKSSTGDTFGKIVSGLSGELLQGRSIGLSDEGITLNNTAMEDCSESTKWRIEVAIMAAIAMHLKSPILLLDGADILDAHNRDSLIKFLLTRIAGQFEHTVLAMTTSKEDIHQEDPLPANIGPVSKWIIDDGKFIELPKTGAPAPVTAGTPPAPPAAPAPPPPPAGYAAQTAPPPPPPPPPGT